MRASGCCGLLSHLRFSRCGISHRFHAQLAHPYHSPHRRLARISLRSPPLRTRCPPPAIARCVLAPLCPRSFLVVVCTALRARAPKCVPSVPSASRTSLRPAFGALRAVTASSLRFHACGHLSLPGTVPLRLEPCPRHRRQLPISRPPRTFFTRVSLYVLSQQQSPLFTYKHLRRRISCIHASAYWFSLGSWLLCARRQSVPPLCRCRLCPLVVARCVHRARSRSSACPASASSGASHMASCTWLPRVASRVGRPDRLRFAIARNEAGEYRTANIVFHEALSMPEAVPGAA